MSDIEGAPRRTIRGGFRGHLVAVLLAVLAVGIIPTATASAATPVARVVIVVGPTESITASYIRDARAIAAQLRGYGARVTEIYSPSATWSRVYAASRGANMLVYLGHGNGYPNPYAPFNAKTVDGMGLNIAVGHGNSNLRYYGEYYVRLLPLAAGAIVILNHACYTTGGSEPGRPLPTRTVARQRSDNFGAGFLRAGASAVFATHSSPSNLLYSLFRTSRTLTGAFWAMPSTRTTYAYTYSSSRTPGALGILAPYPANQYHDSVVGRIWRTTNGWRTTWRP